MKRVIILLSLFSVIVIVLFSCSDNINQPVISLEKSNLCIVEPGFNPNAVLKAGIRCKSFNSGNDKEVYIGNGLLSAGSRTEVDFYNGLTCDSNIVYGNWADTNFVSFSYNPAIGKITATIECNYSFCTEYFTGNLGNLNYIQITIANRATGTTVKFKNVKLKVNGNIYSVGNFSSTNLNDWMINNIDLSNGFTIEGKIILCGTQPDGELNKVQIVVGDASQNFSSYTVQQGWNLIAIPRLAQWMHIDSLIPNRSNPSVFEFNSTIKNYLIVEQLQTGSGYFVRFENQSTIIVPGSIVTNPVQVDTGWNLIGNYDKDLDITQVNTNPAGIIASAFFNFDAFNNVYQASDSLRIGSGYWVRVSESGQVLLNSAVNKNDYLKNFYVKNNWNKIFVKDNKGRVSVLYYGKDIDSKMFLLPPVFPESEFDVRFEDGSYACDLSKEKTLIIKSDYYPITLTAEGPHLSLLQKNNSKAFILKDKTVHKLKNKEINAVKVRIME